MQKIIISGCSGHMGRVVEFGSLEDVFDRTSHPYTQALLRSVGAGADDAEEIASMAGVIEGVDCALTIRELAGGESKISLRTGARINATEACRLLGGGGHAQAAGATLNCSLEEAKRRALEAIAQVSLPDV